MDKSIDVCDSFRIYGYLLVIYGYCIKILNKGVFRWMNGDSERFGGVIYEINCCLVEMSCWNWLWYLLDKLLFNVLDNYLVLIIVYLI